MNDSSNVVLVTGATSGIGRATAIKFVKEGFTVIASGRNQKALSELETQLSTERLHTYAIDLTEEDAIPSLIEFIDKTTGKVDSVVNAAGIIGTGTIETTTFEDWRYMFKLNVDVIFQLTQLSIPYLEQSQLKSIVNVSSVVGLRQFPGVLAYSVSKAAVDQLTKVTALELAPKGIRVNAINPGVIETNLHKRGGMDEKRYAEFLNHSKTTHPLGRVGQPEEAADLIYFLATEQSSWITGQTVALDGGRSLTCFR